MSESTATVILIDVGIFFLSIDIKREIAAFYIVFSQVAKLTRNPASTMMSQQIGSLHTGIKNI